MKNIFNTLKTTLRAKFTSIWKRFKLYTSITYWRTKGITKLRQFFSYIFSVKPRDKKDYYPLFGLLISKRLAFALVIAFAVTSIYIMNIFAPVKNTRQSNLNIQTYKYNSLALKFKKSEVQIMADDGHIAYVGNVYLGQAKGKGSLFDYQNNLIYKGEFDGNMYNGLGTLYYENKNPRYIGQFNDNLYNGEGTLFRENGTIYYKGNFLNGKMHFKGELYNENSKKIYEGNFIQNELVYDEILDKSAKELNDIYLGEKRIYNYESKSFVEMPNINVAYVVSNNENVEDEVKIDGIYVKKNSILFDGKEVTNVKDLQQYLGKPIYYGKTKASFAQNIMLYSLLGTEFEEKLENVFNIKSIPERKLYVYSYEKDDKIYTFYSENDLTTFTMYSILG